MSSLLDQAIVDATALKEAAIKNAEAAVIEKYSTEIKEAVNSLLEQDLERFFDDTTDQEEASSPTGMTVELSPEEEVTLSQIPFTGTEMLDTVPHAPEHDDQIELTIDLQDLAAQLDYDQKQDNVDPEDMTDRGNILSDIEVSDAVEFAPEVPAEQPAVALHENEDIDLEDIDLEGILEELEFDYDPKPSGWAVGADKPTAEMEENYALLASIGELKAEKEDLEEKNKNLEETLKVTESVLDDYKTKNEKYLKVFKKFETKLNEVNLSNARLLYINRALNSSSLNERQKKRIVESISKAQTIEEAKVIYETLESAVSDLSIKKRRGPKSLSEAVNKNSSPFFPRREKRNDREASFADRMKLLAGIKK